MIHRAFLSARNGSYVASGLLDGAVARSVRQETWSYMKPVTQLFVSTVLMCSAAAPSHADTVTISFDQPACMALAGGGYPGDCYAGSGVILTSDINGGRFTAPHFAIASDTHAVSSPNVARAVTGFTDVRGAFIVNGGAPGFTDLVSWNVTGSVHGQDPWEAMIFGTNGLLDAIAGFSDQLVVFSRPGNDVLGLFMSMGTAMQGMDNLSFNAPQGPSSATPEPSTVLLIATGAAVLARRRWNLRAMPIAVTRRSIN